MKDIQEIKDKSIDYKLFESLRKDNLSYVYRGLFTPKITDDILSLAEIGFIQNTDSKAVKRKIYHIMVEGLQNITKHQSLTNGKSYDSGIFVLRREEDKYMFTTCNLIENKDINSVVEQIEHINKLDKDKLKEHYKDILTHGTISEKGGAGLGFIDMCLKSGSRLSYSFKKIDEDYSYFYFHIQVVPKSVDNLVDKYEWLGVKDLHKTLIENGILIIFNSYFNQEGMINLLAIIENQMKGEASMKKRMYSVMVEMIQNIIKHSSDYESTEDGKAGLFYVSAAHNDEYVLHSGNYISKEKIDKLQQLLKHDFVTNQESGLGLIDIRLKSNSNIELDVFDVDSELSFCVMKTQLKK